MAQSPAPQTSQQTPVSSPQTNPQEQVTPSASTQANPQGQVGVPNQNVAPQTVNQEVEIEGINTDESSSDDSATLKPSFTNPEDLPKPNVEVL